jgi:hypothetical protein
VLLTILAGLFNIRRSSVAASSLVFLGVVVGVVTGDFRVDRFGVVLLVLVLSSGSSEPYRSGAFITLVEVVRLTSRPGGQSAIVIGTVLASGS